MPLYSLPNHAHHVQITCVLLGTDISIHLKDEDPTASRKGDASVWSSHVCVNVSTPPHKQEPLLQTEQTITAKRMGGAMGVPRTNSFPRRVQVVSLGLT